MLHSHGGCNSGISKNKVCPPITQNESILATRTKAPRQAKIDIAAVTATIVAFIAAIFMCALPLSNAADAVSATKTVEKTGHNQYDINLSVEGHDWANTEPTDVIFVLDRTGSVGNPRFNIIKEAVKGVSQRLFESGNSNLRIAIGTFTNGYGKGNEVLVSLTNSPNWSKFDSTHVGTDDVEGGGTNWQEGAQVGTKMLNMSSDSSTKHVVFFSDGEPNTYVNSAGKPIYTDNAQTAYTNSLPSIKTMMQQKNTDMTVLSLGDIALMKQFATDTNGAYLTANDANGLMDLMEDRLAAQIMSGTAQNATLTDTLSDYVLPANTDDNGRPFITVDVDGTTIKEGTDYTYTYDANTKTISVTYKKALGSTHHLNVTISVVPSEKAYEQYWENGEYPDKGDNGTGEMSAGKLGFASNVDATASWKNPLNGTTSSTKLPVPVVQVDVVDANIQKVASPNDVNGDGVVSVNDEIGYTFTITNNGNVPTIATLTDEMLGIKDHIINETDVSEKTVPNEPDESASDEAADAEGTENDGGTGAKAADDTNGDASNDDADNFAPHILQPGETIELTTIDAYKITDDDVSATEVQNHAYVTLMSVDENGNPVTHDGIDAGIHESDTADDTATVAVEPEPVVEEPAQEEPQQEEPAPVEEPNDDSGLASDLINEDEQPLTDTGNIVQTGADSAAGAGVIAGIAVIAGIITYVIRKRIMK